MRGFTAPPSRTLALTHGEQSIEIHIQPIPLAYGEYLAEVMPEPKDAAKRDRWLFRRGMLLVAKVAGASLELSAAPPPRGAGAPAWEAYADFVKEELAAAHFVDGDIQTLLDEMARLNRGLGDLPKA